MVRDPQQLTDSYSDHLRPCFQIVFLNLVYKFVKGLLRVRLCVVYLLSENEVYAWGNNTMGQCGQGHTSTPITKPKKVLGLEGVSIQQITAGTSHSLAWTAVPTDR